jgi:hypothetical protein
MSSCEHCWSRSRLLGIEYRDQLSRAERERHPCTQDTQEGARLRAGQFWDEAAQMDKRNLAAIDEGAK